MANAILAKFKTGAEARAFVMGIREAQVNRLNLHEVHIYCPDEQDDMWCVEQE